MRKLSLFLFLASSAMPALAQRSDNGEGQSRREARAERSESRPQRAERAERVERSQQSERRGESQRQIQVERQVQAEGSRAERMQRYQQQIQQRQVQQQQVDGSRDERLQRYREQMQQRQQQAQSGSSDERLVRIRQRQIEAGQPGSGGLVQRDRRIRTIPAIRPEAGQIGPVRTDVRRDGRDNRRWDRDGRSRWSNNWRNDRRYDWRDYRNRHRSIFNIGLYFDPFGFNYSRFGIGSYLYPNYYQSNYWINDPWQYRLPPAYGSYRWIRYHNDAILIDTYTGEVEDVIYGFFW